MNKKFFWSLISSLTLILFKANLVLAQSNAVTGVNDLTNAGVNLAQSDLKQVIANIINIFLGFLGVLAVVLILYAGFLWMTSRGDEEKIKTAKGIIVSAVIGLVIILSAYAIASFVLNKLYEATNPNGNNNNGGVIVNPIIIPPDCPEPDDEVVKICKVKPDASGATIGQYITIEGWNFEAYNAVNSKVKFDGGGVIQEASLINCNGQVAWSHLNNRPDNYFRIKAIVPNVDLGNYRIKINTANNNEGSYPDLATFEVRAGEPGPGIACITPSSQRRGEGIMIEGIGFANAGYIDLFNWDGNIWQSNRFSSVGTWTDNKITNAIVPMSALSGELFVEVEGIQSAPEDFNVLCDNGQSDCVSGCCAANACVDADFCLNAAIIENNGPVISRISPEIAKEGSIISIYGSGFGSSGGRVVFEGDNNDEKFGIDPSDLNPECTQYWSDNLIIVVVPEHIKDLDAKVWVRDSENRESNDKTFNDSGEETPSLCKAEPSNGSFGDLVILHGLNFTNTDRAFFGGVSGAFTWDSAQKAKVTVPNLSAGDISLWLKNTNDKSSNELPFSIEAAGGGAPIINSVSPDNAPVGQYLTILGSNFGNTAGRVEFIKATGEIVLADVNFPNQCATNYWHNDNIVVKVPNSSAENYQIKVKRHTDQASSNAYNFAVRVGTPGPGLCLMQPNNGPANNLFSVNLYGDNFGNTGQVNFTVNQLGIVNSWSDQLVNVKVPSGAVTGPVKVRVGTQDSNALNFAVSSCTNDTQCGANMDCCQEATGNYCAPLGHCAIDLSCEYSWTVTTAADPFSLQETYECNNDNLQSPSPWPDGLQGRQSRDAYLDTNISALFNADVDDADFNPANIQVKACNTGGEFIDACNTNVAVNLSIINHNSNQEGFVLNPGVNLEANRWYKVVLGEFNKANGNEVWSGASYDWHFRTQENLCEVHHISVTPTDSPMADIYVGETREFSASPVALNCNLCGSNYNWSEWTLQGLNASRASIEDQIVFNTNIARAWVQGEQVTENMNPATVELRASLPSALNGAPITLEHSAHPKIIDAVLEVVDYGPNCDSSCRNALVWARFNTSILSTSLAGNIDIRQCSDETCAQLISNNLVTYSGLTEHDYVGIGHNDFLVNQWYKVRLLMGLKNIAGYNLNSEFSWKFKVSGAEACTPASLSIDPAYHLATNDDQIDYFAMPYSAANACDPHGQALDPTDYTNYVWTLDPGQVADLQISDIYQVEVTPRNNGIAHINASMPQYSVTDQATLEVHFGDVSVYPAPKISDTKPQTPACLNSAVEVRFNTLMDRTSVEAGLHLYKKSANEAANCVKKSEEWYCPVETDFVFTTNNNQSKAWLYPTTSLATSTSYLALVSGSVQSSMGVKLASEILNFDSDNNTVNDTYIWLFETNNQVCHVSFVTVDPGQDLFSCARSNCQGDTNIGLSGNQHSYLATAYDASGSPLVMQTYHWQENNDLLTLVNNNQPSIEATAVNENGNTTLIVTASDPQAGSASGSASINLFLCEHPWPSVGNMATPFPYDFGGLYNFSTYYCQDSGRVNEPLLPYLRLPNILLPNGQTLREFIFIVDPKQTVIATRDENIQQNWWQNLLARVKNTVLAAVAIPSAPNNLVLADNSADGVRLQWQDTATNEDGFNIYRKSSTVDWYKIATVAGANQNPIYFTDNNVINNEVYSYRVTAYNYGGESATTNEITVTAKASSLDVIGVRVMQNSEHLSINDWYKKYAPNPEIAGQAQVVNGYPALKVGNTVYINALNVHVDANGNRYVYSNIYMLSYSIGARESTAAIASQMLANFHFSTNIDNNGFCSSDVSVSCSSNFDCPNQGNCDADGDKLRRDNKRLGDLLSIQNKLISYSDNYKFCKNNGNISCTQDSQCPSGGICVPYYPLLNAGTYVAGMSVSPWPSWQQEFSSVLGGVLPVDPLNRLGACAAPGFDPDTCWNDEVNRFTCPANSSIYFYKNEGGDDYSLDAKFEFIYPNSGYNFNPSLDEHIQRDNPQCNNVSFIPDTPGLQGCGNGVKDGAEECDGGFQNLCDETVGQQSWWNEHLGGCYPKGSLDADGNLRECTWYEPSPALTAQMCGGSCGDFSINSPYELCESTDAQGIYEFNGINYSCANGASYTCNTCSVICADGSVASPASCGDGVINPSEECDTNNLNNKDCPAFGYDYGTLSCNQCNFDISNCTYESPPPAICGNDIQESAEQCDGIDLNEQSCVSLNLGQGTLSCNASCLFNTASCTNPQPAICGNNIQDGAEQCDGIDLNEQSCASLNLGQGTLSCNASCLFNTSDCVLPPAIPTPGNLSVFLSAQPTENENDPVDRLTITLRGNYSLASFAGFHHYEGQYNFVDNASWSNSLSTTNNLLSWYWATHTSIAGAKFRVRACSVSACGAWADSAYQLLGEIEQ